MFESKILSKKLKQVLNWLALCSVLFHFFVLHQGAATGMILCHHEDGQISLESAQQHSLNHALELHDADSRQSSWEQEFKGHHDHGSSSSHPEFASHLMRTQEIENSYSQSLIFNCFEQMISLEAISTLNTSPVSAHALSPPDRPRPDACPEFKSTTILLI